VYTRVKQIGCGISRGYINPSATKVLNFRKHHHKTQAQVDIKSDHGTATARQPASPQQLLHHITLALLPVHALSHDPTSLPTSFKSLLSTPGSFDMSTSFLSWHSHVTGPGGGPGGGGGGFGGPGGGGGDGGPGGGGGGGVGGGGGGGDGGDGPSDVALTSLMGA
jgi:hypothetical protein